MKAMYTAHTAMELLHVWLTRDVDLDADNEPDGQRTSSWLSNSVCL